MYVETAKKHHAIVECSDSRAKYRLQLIYLVRTKNIAYMENGDENLQENIENGTIWRHDGNEAVVFSRDKVLERAKWFLEMFQNRNLETMKKITSTIKDSKNFADWCQRGMSFIHLAEACWMVSISGYVTKITSIGNIIKGDHILYKTRFNDRHSHHCIIIKDVLNSTNSTKPSLELVYCSHELKDKGLKYRPKYRKR